MFLFWGHFATVTPSATGRVNTLIVRHLSYLDVYLSAMPTAVLSTGRVYVYFVTGIPSAIGRVVRVLVIAGC